VRLQARWHAEIIRQVPPSAFHPRPKVDSAILEMRPRDRGELPAFSEGILVRLVRLGFSQRRKQLKNLLTGAAGSWADLVALLGISPTARAEELSLEQWIELARQHDPHPLKDTPQSKDELFDVVDDDDRVTGQATRDEVHARGLKHRAVHIFAFRKNGDLLLQKRSHLKDTCPGLWDSSAAGHLDAGETYDACVARELAEELGLENLSEAPSLIARIAACPETGFEFVELYALRGVGRVTFPAAEIECIHAFAPSEIDAWTAARPHDFAPGFLRCWREYRGSEPV
jgi:16S rRNA (adenine1518-N6/adenine1519-N6)-dimethyltransferase